MAYKFGLRPNKIDSNLHVLDYCSQSGCYISNQTLQQEGEEEG